jgi:hypothetical protein
VTEITVDDLPAWKLSGREEGNRLEITLDRAKGWIKRDVLGDLCFPSTLMHTFRVQCYACKSAVVKVEVASLEAFKALMESGPILCRDCQSMADIAASGVQAIGPR